MHKVKEFLHERRLQLAKLLQLAFVLSLLCGLWLGVFYALPMLQGNYSSAAGATGGDRAVALYDLALSQYQAQEYEDAVKTLNDAFTAASGKDGELSKDEAGLAAKIKFLSGNALVKTKQVEQAKEAYREALRLDPQHLFAKYNLELLEKNPPAGGGGGQNQDPDSGGGSGRPPKKGI